MRYSDVKSFLESALELTEVMRESEQMRDRSIENANDKNNVFWTHQEQIRWENKAAEHERNRAKAYSILKEQFVILNQLINCE